MTVRIYLKHVKRIYSRQVGAGQLRDEGRLEGAVNAPFQEVFGQVLYPTLPAKAGKLLDGIQRVQAYTDGNKRLAWHSTVAFLQLNGQVVEDTSAVEVDGFIRALEGRKDAEHYAAAWLNTRMRGVI